VISQVEELDDGRYNIVLDGQARVRLRELPQEAMYRRAEATPFPEDEGWLETEEAERGLRDVLVMSAALNLVREGENPESLLGDPFARSVIVNRVASVVMAEAEERQALLGARGYRERTGLLIRQLRISLSLAESLARHPKPEDPGLN
jgi:Lon protease-like protein